LIRFGVLAASHLVSQRNYDPNESGMVSIFDWATRLIRKVWLYFPLEQKSHTL